MRDLEARRIASGLGLALIACLGLGVGPWAPTVGAHEGQPYPVLEGAEVGPYRIDLWSDPDFGEGEFWMIVADAADPAALEVRLDAAPEAEPQHRLEALAAWQPTKDRPDAARYVALLPLDRDGWWTVDLSVAGPSGAGSARTRVEVRSLGPSRREALAYLLPFGFLALLVAAHQLRRGRRARSGEAAASA